MLYYSAFGYVAIVANAIADGARAAGAEVDVRRVPETTDAVAEDSPFHAAQDVPVAQIGELADYDAIIVGSPTRFGRLSSPIAAFLEQASGLASRGVLNGKVGGAFASPGGAHGGHGPPHCRSSRTSCTSD